MVVAPNVTVQRRLDFFTRSEMMGLQDLLDMTIEAFGPAVDLRRFRRCQPMFGFQCGAEFVKLMCPGSRPFFSQTKEAVCELFSINRPNCMKTHPGRDASDRAESAGRLAAVLLLQTRVKTHLIARSVATEWQKILAQFLRGRTGAFAL